MRPSHQVHPADYLRPKERFPYSCYQSLGTLHICLGIFITAAGCFDVSVHFRPEWFLYPSRQPEYVWNFWGNAWVNPAVPIITGGMVTLHGVCSTCTCRSSCVHNPQEYLRNSVLRWSIWLGLILLPATIAIGTSRAVFTYATLNHLLAPCLWSGLAVADEIVEICSMALACCCTEYDVEIPYELWQQTPAFSPRTSVLAGMGQVTPKVSPWHPTGRGDSIQSPIELVPTGGAPGWNIPGRGHVTTRSRPGEEGLPGLIESNM